MITLLMRGAPVEVATIRGLAAFPVCIRRVLESHAFEKTPVLRSLLVFLWEHREETVSEYAIATRALGRSSDFDPQIDATVRVQISRLRQRLERFYASEGKDCPERLVIPLGVHQLQITIVGTSAIPEAVPEALPEGPSRLVRWLASACAVLLTACIVLAVLLLRSRSATPISRETPAAFWRAFYANGLPARVILPTPIFVSFHVPNRDPNASLMFRDTDVNDFDSTRNSAPFQLLKRSLGEPELAQNYTVTSDTFASVHLIRYLDRVGLDANVLSSADAPLAALDRENVIALGTWGTLTPLKPYLDQMSFMLDSHERIAVNRAPRSTEPRKVEMVRESETRSIWPGVIAIMPGSNGRSHLLMLTSRHTAALVSFLTSSTGLLELQRIWKANGSPGYYEVLVNAEMDDTSLVRFWAVALHPYRAAPQRF
ncbi:MAG TPA: helix-turn-helix domain-containing protein [Bryobacteraceae bacterium]|nr:helix-turn-helix domain-containing protein [Bryobacteraceae bacterium]